MSGHTRLRHFPPSSALAPSLRMLATQLWTRLLSDIASGQRRLKLAYQVRLERKELGALDERLLKDIAIDRIDALQETRRAFLDVPKQRLHYGPGEK